MRAHLKQGGGGRLVALVLCGPATIALAQGGDTIEDATVIDSLPFSDTGTTVGYADDYDEQCPYPDSIAPDVVYAFTPPGDLSIEINLCESGYDTKVYVYDDPDPPPGGFVACSDDACSDSQGNPYRSLIPYVGLTGGTTYYIVIDGYGEEAGTYQLMVVSDGGQEFACPPGATPEGEPPCHDEYDDLFNYGCCCHFPPPAFSPISCGETICGETGTYTVQGLSYRDSDWYILDVPDGASSISLTGQAELPFLLFFIEERGEPGECDFEVVASASGQPMEVISIEIVDPPYSTYYPWAGTSAFDGWPCGWQYWITAGCETGCVGDLNGDGAVDVADLLALLAAWGDSNVPADLDGSGTVDVGDLLILLAAWGEC